MKHTHHTSSKTKNVNNNDRDLDSIDDSCNLQKVLRSYQIQIEQLKQENNDLREQLAASQDNLQRNINDFDENCNKEDPYQKHQANEIASLHKKIIEISGKTNTDSNQIARLTE